MIDHDSSITLVYVNFVAFIQGTIKLSAFSFAEIVLGTQIITFLVLSSFHKFFFQHLLLFYN